MARSDAEYMTASIIPLLKNLLFLSLAYTLASIYDGVWGFPVVRKRKKKFFRCVNPGVGIISSAVRTLTDHTFAEKAYWEGP